MVPNPYAPSPNGYPLTAGPGTPNFAQQGVPSTPLIASSLQRPGATYRNPQVNPMQRAPSHSSLNPARTRQVHSAPLSKRPDPLPPFHPITSYGQARATTYPSRLRLGLTSLVQPLGPSGFGASAAPSTSTILGKRQRTAVNYAELENLDDGDDDSDSDYNSSGGATPRSRILAARRAAEEKAKGTPPPSTGFDPKKLPGSGKTYLGQVPPSNAIVVEPAIKTRHSYLYVVCMILASVSTNKRSNRRPDDMLAVKAQEKAVLVPIRVEFDTESHRYRDCFVWNIKGAVSPPSVLVRH